jgi:hypothetical protein
VNLHPRTACSPARLARAAVAETNRAPLIVIELSLDAPPRASMRYDNFADREQLAQWAHAHKPTRHALKSLGFLELVA